MNWTIATAVRRFVLIGALFPAVSFAQLFPVPLGENGSSDPAMTFLYEAKDAKATVIFIPGGAGSAGMKADWDATKEYFLRGRYDRMLQRLSDPGVTSGNLNVVIYDSPMSLGDARTDARAGADHLSRIESVVRFYEERLKRPVWLMGHSNGTVSIAEFYKYLQRNKSENLVAGLIYSGGKNEASFGENTRIPVLFIHHGNDGCSYASAYHTQRLFDKLKEGGNVDSQFVLIKTGGPDGWKDLCHSGYHMYFGAKIEVADVIDQFVTKHMVSP